VLTGGRLILAVHGTDVWEPVASRAAQAALRAADMILSVSQFTIDRMARWHPPVRNKGRVIPNTIRAERFGPAPRDAALAARLGLAGKRVILTLGRMAANERAKGFDEVIEAIPLMRERCPDLVYLCAGDGDDRARLAAKAAALGLGEAVVFAGGISEAQKPEIYRLADAFVLASRGEGFGIVLLEALACGIPVLGSTADATQEALLDGKLGPAVDPRDRAALADAILAVIERPRIVPDGLSHYAFDKFQSRFDAVIGDVMS
jgi:phosphatidylinositol alpha-1,6-mannosyltransferase